MKNEKIINFPTVYYISLNDSIERQKMMNEQLNNLGIENKLIIAYDGRINNYQSDNIVSGLYFNQLDSGQIAVVISHLKAIKDFYYNSNNEYAIFMEDDMSMESINYWNFTWEDIMNNLPNNWKSIQLSLIKEDLINNNDISLQKRLWWFWSAGAYMITREYAKNLIDEYCIDEKYELRIKKNLSLLPLIENVLFLLGEEDIYTLPLFVENINFSSTFYPNFIDNTHKKTQIDSANYINNWWKDNGKNINIENIIKINKKDTNELNKALMNYIIDPKNGLYNFNLGKCYEDIGHTASAASYYIRTAEHSTDELLIYEALLRVALCFEKQGSRVFTLKGVLLRAISLLPNRPEAYFLLSRTYEINKDWQESYTFATIGEKLINDNEIPLKSNVEYPGKYGFIYEKAVTSWWIGLYDESIYLFKLLDDNYNMLDIYKQSVKINLNNLNKLKKDKMKN